MQPLDQEKDYFESNKDLWNRKTELHIDSEFYDNKTFLEGRNSLNQIELEYLTEIKGKKVLHIQCHFGQDSISLARMGAQVTATDISDKALDAARRFNTQCGTDVTFVETDTYHINDHLTDRYDLIFMSYGVICWLPDLERLFDIIYDRLAPGGKVLSVEFHPMLMTFDFDTKKIAYGYKNHGVYEEVLEASYVEQQDDLTHPNPLGREYFWQHSLAEIMMPLVNKGVPITSFREYYYSPYNIFGSMAAQDDGRYIFGDFPYPIPHVYLMEWTKPTT